MTQRNATQIQCELVRVFNKIPDDFEIPPHIFATQVSEKEEIFLGQTSLIIAQVIPLHHRLNVALIMMPS